MPGNSPLNAPKPSAFGIAPKRVAYFNSVRNPGWLQLGVLWVALMALGRTIFFAATGHGLHGLAIVEAVVCVYLADWLRQKSIQLSEWRKPRQRDYRAFLRYQEACQQYEEASKREAEAERKRRQEELEARRRQEDYWRSLSGVQFERELGTLFKRGGFEVEFTPVTGDEGIDLILKRAGRTVIVQCKRHIKPVGPSTVRELFGSLIHSRADEAILASVDGFTRGVYEFVSDKPIRLIELKDILQMQEQTRASSPVRDASSTTPVRDAPSTTARRLPTDDNASRIDAFLRRVAKGEISESDLAFLSGGLKCPRCRGPLDDKGTCLDCNRSRQ